MSNANNVMMYFFGKKIRPGQIWKDYCNTEYSVLSIVPETSMVSLKSSDGRSFMENASDLLAACILKFDPIKNKEEDLGEEA